MHEESGAIGDVLIERAAERDVQQLVAATDREHRHASVHRGIDERELEAVGDVIDPVDRRMRILAVAARIDVGTAGQHEPGERREDVGSVAVVVQSGRRKDDRLRAGPLERIGVAPRQGDRSGHPRRDTTGLQMPTGDGHERTGHLLSSPRRPTDVRRLVAAISHERHISGQIAQGRPRRTGPARGARAGGASSLTP